MNKKQRERLKSYLFIKKLEGNKYKYKVLKGRTKETLRKEIREDDRIVLSKPLIYLVNKNQAQMLQKATKTKNGYWFVWKNMNWEYQFDIYDLK